MSNDNSIVYSEQSSKLGKKQVMLEEEQKREDCDDNKIIAMDEIDEETYEDEVPEKEEGSTKTNTPKRNFMIHVL